MRRLCAVALSVLLATGLLAGSTGSASSAQAQSTSTPKAAPSYPIRGQSFAITGRISTKVARPVELQRKVGSKWKKVASAKTNSKGAYSFKMASSASSTQLRVMANKIKIGKKTYQRIISKVTKLRTVSVTPAAPMAGETFTVAETLGKKGIRAVQLQRKSGSRWVKIGSAKTNSAGSFKVSASLSGSASLRVVAPKTKIKKKKYSAITMKSFRVTTSAQNGSISLPSTGVTGQALIAAVKFAPARAGRTVQLQQLVGSQWTTVATGVQSSTGTATLGTAPATVGTFSYRGITTAYRGAAAVTTANATVTVTSGVAEPSIVIGTLAPAVTGESYSTDLAAAGGTAPFTWTATGLPDGVTLSSSGVLSGTPTTPGTYDVHFKITDANGKTAEADTQIVVRPVVGISFDTLPTAVAGDDYDTTLNGTGGTEPYTWSAEDLPVGFILTSEGRLSGVTTSVGDHQVTLTITDANNRTAQKTVTLVVTEALAISTVSLPAGEVGSAYTTTLSASGGTTPYSWSATGLPDGLSLSNAGVLSGTPTTPGSYSAVAITVSDDNGGTASASFTVEIAAVLSIATAGLPAGVAGTEYTETTLAAAAGTGPYTWTATGLPDGLELSSAGVLAGTPTAAGTFDAVAITVTDSNSKTAQKTFSITIAKAVHITTASLPAGVVGTDYPETTLAAADGNSATYTWTSTTLPNGLTLSSAGVLTGTPTADATTSVTFTATDAAGKTATAELSITIAKAVHITTTNLPAGVVGTEYTETTLAAADGNSATYTWTSTTLPAGLELTEAGVLSGTPTTDGTFDAVVITVTDADGKTAQAVFSVTIAQAVHITTADLPAGVVGTEYTETTLAAADGTAPYAWSATGLPNGLSLTEAGVLSGTPTADGTFDAVVVTATDAGGKTAEATFTITIGKAVHITTTSLPAGVVGTEYSVTTLTAADGNGPYTWTSATLPTGLSLTEAGVLSGTPTVDGTFDAVVVTATDADGKTAEATFSITIAKAVHITTASLPAGVVGTDYPETTLAAADGNSATYTWTSTTLPNGLTLSSAGVLTGTPTADATTSVTFTATDAAGKTATAELSITIAKAVHITTTNLPAGVVGTEYTETTLAAADGNSATYTWTSTTLPAGLELTEAGVLSGTPTTDGTFDAVVITVTDADGKTAETTFTIVIAKGIHITTTSLPAGVIGTEYPETTLAAADGTSPYTWTATGLPEGLSLAANGTLTGTPAEQGSFTVTVTATDSAGKHTHTDFALSIGAAVSVSTSALPTAVVGTSYSATVSAAGGTSGYTWQVAMLPDGLSLNTATGEITGIPTSPTTTWVAFTVTDAAGKTAYRELALTVKPAVHITTTSLPGGVVGTAYSATLTAADGTGPYTWSATGLPMSLTLAADGTITGTPNAAGTFDEITITATDANSKTAVYAADLTVIPAVHVTTTSLPGGVAGTEYPETDLVAADGTGPYTWTASGLPEGFTLSEDGTLAGTPTAAGTAWVAFTATDHNGKTAIRDLQVVVAAAVHITTTDLPQGVVNEAYPETTVAAAGGNGSNSWGATGLPEGLSLNSGTGVINGTPTQAGTYESVQITVTDAAGKTATTTFTITIRPVIAITTAELADGVRTEAYSATLAGLGGTAPYTWAVTGLPEGLSLNTSTGEISGAATEAGSFDLDVTLTDDHSKTATTSISLTVHAQVGITTVSLPSGGVGTDYTAQLAASGGTPGYTWSAATLPNGLSLDANTGAVTGNPTTTGSTWVAFTVTDGHGTTDILDLAITINPAVHITTTSLPAGVVGTAYTTGLVALDGTDPYSWAATTLPDGLAINTETGAITGTPTTDGTTEVTITVTDANNKTAQAVLSLVIAKAVHVATTSLPAGVVGTEYPQTTLAAGDGNNTSYTWTSTTLPDGLTFTEAGLLSGTPTTDGTTEVTFTVTDAAGKTAQATFSIIIAKAVHITTTSLPTVEAGDPYPETTLAAADGAPGYTWSSTTLPAGLSLTEAGILTGTPTTDGTTAVTFTVTDANGKTNSVELSITITAAAHLTNTALSIGVIGGDYTTTLTADGGTAPYTITAENLPSGLILSDGVITGTPSASAINTPVELTVTDAHSKSTTTTLGLTVTKPATESSGSGSACAITPTGGVECWGSNTAGQLGDGTTTNSLYPVKVTGLDGTVISIAVGTNHTCALLATGSVQCWGYNNYGQLGTGTGDNSTTPVDVVDINNAVSIASGSTLTCATLSNGTASCWGIGINGQLGNGGLVSSNHPVAVSNLTGVMEVQTGTSHACAVTTTGSVSCWGRNQFRQLGASIATGTSSTPVAVPDVSGVVDLSTHLGNHTCVATNTGAVKCWGQNSYAQVGTTAGANVADAITVSDVTDAARVAVGANHSCAITSAGAMRCWGGNSYGQLGANASGSMSVASFAVDLGATAASASAGASFTCARTTTGTLLCWGNNSSGQLANGYAGTAPLPMTVPALSGFSTISVGDGFSCGLTTGGGVKCWGSNSDGQLGDGTTTNSIQPVQVSGLDSGVATIDVGTNRACALTTSGAVKCWGNNSDGALGIGTQIDSSVPVTPTDLDSGVVSVSTADRSTCAVLTDGTARCSGENGAYQLGDGSNITRTSPVQVGNLTDAASVSVGAFHACVITTSGGLKCWGGNYNGAVGDGTTNSPVSYPVVVSGLTSGVTTVAAGSQTTCAVVDSAVKCWGYNPFGQVGDGTTTDVLAPITVPGLSSGMADVRTGIYHVCARATSGAVSCWGSNSNNQLGDGTTTERHAPTPVTGLSGAANSIAVGGRSSCALLNNSTVECWGDNTNGQLGIQTATNPTPAPVTGFNVAPLAAGAASLPAGVVGTTYASGQLTATGGVAPYTWTATGLPAGLSMNTDGSLTGTPTTDGTSEVTLTVTDARRLTATTTASITIAKAVHITTSSLPGVEAGDAYPETTLAAADGAPGYTWSSTTLPAGLSLTEAGVLSGTPTTDGTTAVMFTVTDANGKTNSVELSITITAAAHLTSTSLSIGVIGGDYTTTLTAEGGTAPYTITAENLPTGLSLTDGVISGTPTAAGTNTSVELTVTDARAKATTTTLGLTVVKPKTETGGNATTCAITPTGGIECWGLNSSGQIGDGTTTNRRYPAAVTDLGGKAISVSTGLNHTCAVLSNGKIRCWGANYYGQLGTVGTSSLTPVAIAGIDSAVTVEAGQSFTCATFRDGTASCWGLGTSGQIGNGSSSSVTTPTAVNNLTNLMDVETGGTHACALTTSGTVSCWGRNQYRQIGAGAAADVPIYNAPVAVPDVSGVVSLSAHMGAFTCAATDTGEVKCWGNGSAYQLGSTSVTTSGDALTVPDVTDAVEVVAGGAQACAINAAGAMRCWGYNLYGQLGDGSIGTNSATPVTAGIADPVASAGAGTNHTCARTTTGTLNCWGGNGSGQLGNGYASAQPTPLNVPALNAGITSVGGGSNFSCALNSSGGVLCWGTNNNSQLGNGTTTSNANPGAVSGLESGVTAIAVGSLHACAVTAGGGVKCWGRNNSGQLGDETLDARSVPVDVHGLSSGVIAISAGGESTCALTDAGAVKCWGDNSTGQLGDGTQTDRPTPVEVSGLSTGVTAISAGSYHTCALVTGGGVRCWGSGNSGELGNGSGSSDLPVTPTGMSSGVTTISAGLSFTCAVTDAGAAKCWGTNGYGQIGDGTTTARNTPTDVTDLSSGVAGITAGGFHTCATTTAGDVKCWGYNASGQLGNGLTTSDPNPNPVDVIGLTEAIGTVAAGEHHTCAITSVGGGLLCWGAGQQGQLGQLIDRNPNPGEVIGFDTPDITTATLPTGMVGEVYAETTMQATGATSPYTWSATGLPDGLALSSGGVLTGTPTVSGSFNAVKITATGANGKASEVTFTITIATALDITSTSLDSGVVGGDYTGTFQATGGTAPYVWSATGLPAGLSLDASTGAISGTPTTNGAFPVEITVTDHYGYAETATIPLSVLAVAGVASDLTSIDGGGLFTCAVNNVGGVECWGYNTQGQLGNGTTTTSLSPVNVTGLASGVAAVTAANSFACALTNAGGVKCWGFNTQGQLGNGTTANSTTPVDVDGLTSGVTAITAGTNFACALTDAGGVKCWGYNFYGQLGNTTNNNSTTPVDVDGLTSGVATISAGLRHVCAVTDGGGAKCWGYNYYGQLGNGTTNNTNAPVDVTDLASGATSVTSGNNHSCALTTDGGIKCWGYNSAGQLGNGTTANSTTPVAVTGISSGATSVTGGSQHTCALTAGGAKCWGYNSSGQLGSATTTTSTTPVDVTGLASGTTAIAAGGNHTCAITSSHDVACWGENSYGQLGNGQSSIASSPLTATGLASGAAATAAGYNHNCALTTDGGVKCWGNNGFGQLGNGTTTTSSTAVEATGLASGATAVAAGGSHSCALTTAGGVKCWGSNGNGQLGNGTTTDSSTAVEVTGLASGVTAITAGGSHTCALTTGGGIKCWGNNFAGAVGNGTTNDSYIPVDVDGLTSGVTAITAGGSHTCALTTGGGIKCWGYNETGELGNGTTTTSSTPVDVDGLTSGATAVDAGGSETCALTTDGGIKCWGYNNYGQLGDGTTTTASTPVNVSGLSTGVTVINVGGYHACAITSTGGTKCWGQGAYGQLGSGAATGSTTPVDVTGLASGVASISAGNQHTCAVTTDGALKCWGYNALGQLGNSDIVTLTPGAVVGHTFTPTS